MRRNHVGDAHGRLASETQATSERGHGTSWQGQDVQPGQERCPLKVFCVCPATEHCDQGPGDKEPLCFC